MEQLKLVLLGKDAKIACIIVAKQRGYYDDEKLDIGTPEVVSGGFPEAMPMLSDGTVDVLPFGSIPTCTYVGQGDDLVIFGGTVTNGSEALVLAENKDKYKTAEDFKGKKIACFRMEPGHIVTKSWLRQQGLKIGDKPEQVDNGEADVAFVLLESMAAEAAAAVATRGHISARRHHGNGRIDSRRPGVWQAAMIRSDKIGGGSDRRTTRRSTSR